MKPAAPAFSAASLFHSSWSLGFVSLSGFALNVALARLLPVEDFGRMRVVRTAIEFLAIPAALGMAACASREAALRRAGEASSLAAAFATTLAWTLVGGLLACVPLWAAIAFASPFRDPAAGRALAWAAFAIPPMAAFACLRGFLQGAGRIPELARAQAGRSVALLALAPAGALAGGLLGWAAARVLAEIAAAAATFRACRIALRDAGGRAGVRFDRELAWPFLRFGAFAALAQTVFAVVGAADVILLERLLADPRRVAVYGAATLFFNTALLLPNAYVQAHFSRFGARGDDPSETFGRFVQASMMSLLLAAPAAFACWVGAPLVAVVLGPDYREAAVVFRWMIPAFVLQCAGIVGGNFAVIAGRVGWNLVAMSVVAAVNVALNLRLIPRFELAGAVMATTASAATLVATTWILMTLHRASGGRR